MNYCVVVQARGKELDYLRGEAYRVARRAQIGTLNQETWTQHFALRLRT